MFMVGIGLKLKIKIGLRIVLILFMLVMIIFGVCVLLYVWSILLLIIGSERKMLERYYSFI